MKEITNVQRAQNYLVKIFKAVNEDYFEGKLEMPSITIQSSLKAYAHISVDRIWSNGETRSYELNISADFLNNRDITQVSCSLIHECCHLYAIMNHIKDTSNRFVFHNGRFRKIAEEKGHLIVKRHDKYGFCITEPSLDTVDFCIRHGFEDIKIGRNTYLNFGGLEGGNSTPKDNGAQPTPTKIKKGNSRRYVCPKCGTIIRATKEVNVVCGDCNVPFELTE